MRDPIFGVVAGATYAIVVTLVFLLPYSYPTRTVLAAVGVAVATILLALLSDGIISLFDLVDHWSHRPGPRRGAAALFVLLVIGVIPAAHNSVSDPKHTTSASPAQGVNPSLHGAPGLATSADPPVWVLDSTGTMCAQVGSVNVTRGDEAYSATDDAGYDDVVKVQIIYENHSTHTGLPNIVADVSPPTTKNQTAVISVQVSANDASKVTVSTTVKLNDDRETLQYIPRSITWNHAITGDSSKYTVTSLQDTAVFNNPSPVDSLGPQGASSIALMYRVVIPAMSVQVAGRGPASNVQTTSFTARIGDQVLYQISVQNIGNLPIGGLRIGDYIPPGAVYETNSTQTRRTPYNGNASPWTDVPDGLIDPLYPSGHDVPANWFDGLPLGDLAVGDTIDARFVVTLRGPYSAGDTLNDVAWAVGTGMQVFNNVAETSLES